MKKNKKDKNEMTRKERWSQTLGMVQVALFAALIMIMAFTPFLGYIPLGFTRATIIHIPVIIGSIVMGPKKGAILGGIFGLTSLINNTMNPTVTSFVFTPFYSVGEVSGGLGSLIICFVPRILVGVLPYFIYRILHRILAKKEKGTVIALASAGVVGSLTNTLLVMHLIYIFFKDAYAAASGVASDALYGAILAVIGTNGIPEAIVAAVIVAFLGKTLLKSKLANS